MAKIKENVYFENDTIIASTEYAAKFFGVTAQTLSNWEGSGCPKYKYGYWDIKAVNDYLQKKQGAKLAEDIEDNLEKMSISAQKTYYDTQLKQAQLEATTFKNAINRGDYLERQYVVDSLKTFAVVLKRSLVGLGNKLSRDIAPFIDIQQLRIVKEGIDHTISDTLEQLSVEGVYSAKKE